MDDSAAAPEPVSGEDTAGSMELAPGELNGGLDGPISAEVPLSVRRPPPPPPAVPPPPSLELAPANITVVCTVEELVQVCLHSIVMGSVSLWNAVTKH